jgi:hypothetical protein
MRISGIASAQGCWNCAGKISMKINRCSVMGKRGFQYNDGTCHIGMSARSKAEADAAASGEAWVSVSLDGGLIDEEGNATDIAKKVSDFVEEGWKIAVTSSRSSDQKEEVKQILEKIGVASNVQQIHLTESQAKGSYFRDKGFHPVFHIDRKQSELDGMPDTTRGIHVSQLQTD